MQHKLFNFVCDFNICICTVLFLELVFLILLLFITFGYKNRLEVFKNLLVRISIYWICLGLTFLGVPNFFFLFASYWFSKDLVNFLKSGHNIRWRRNNKRFSICRLFLCLFFCLRFIGISHLWFDFYIFCNRLNPESLIMEVWSRLKNKFIAHAMNEEKSSSFSRRYYRAALTSPVPDPEQVINEQASSRALNSATIIDFKALEDQLRENEKQLVLIRNKNPYDSIYKNISNFSPEILDFRKKNLYCKIPIMTEHLKAFAFKHIPVLDGNDGLDKIKELSEMILISEILHKKKIDDIPRLICQYADIFQLLNQKHLWENKEFLPLLQSAKNEMFVGSPCSLRVILEVFIQCLLKPNRFNAALDKTLALNNRFIEAMWYLHTKDIDSFYIRLSITRFLQSGNYDLIHEYTKACAFSLLYVGLYHNPSNLLTPEFNLLNMLHSWESEIQPYINEFNTLPNITKQRPINFGSLWVSKMLFVYIAGIEELYNEIMETAYEDKHEKLTRLKEKIQNDLENLENSVYYENLCNELKLKAEESHTNKKIIETLFPKRYTKDI